MKAREDCGAAPLACPKVSPARLMEPLLLALVLTAAAKVYLLDNYLNHDSVWLLIAAGRMLDGGTYLNDFFEVNPPLALIVHAPAVLAGRLFGVDNSTAYFGLVVLAVLASYVMLKVVAAPVARTGSAIWRWLPLSAAAALLLFPGFDLGQREHLIVIMALPYLALQAAAAAGGRPVAWVTVMITLWACLGLFLKPMYLLFPVALAARRAFRRRALAPLFALDMLTIGCAGVAYSALVLLVFPEYFDVAAAALTYYGAYSSASILVYVLPLPYLVILAAPLYFFRHLGGTAPERKLFQGLALFGAVASLALVAQQKGWSYHQAPLQVASELSVLFAVIAIARRLRAGASRSSFVQAARLAPFAVVALLAIGGMKDPFLTSREELEREPLYPVLAELAAGKSLFVFGTSVQAGLQWVAPLDVEWASRFSCLWLLPGYVADRENGVLTPAQAAVVASELRLHVIEDFERFRPAVVLVDRDTFKQGFKRPFDYLEFFVSGERFSRLWLNYQHIDSVGGMDVYLLRERPDRAGPALLSASGETPPDAER
ncbi:MAG: hypothetical protein OEN55_17140 [Alphaproteobacteria bacterium]|nr:hypothetical protein [Alphaproteobacteria bacterium]